jgi:putative sterol carrier protein
MSLENITETIQKKLAMAPSINAKVKFDFDSEGVLFIDATQNPPVLSHEDLDSDVTFQCSTDVFVKIMNGQQDPTMAYMMGKLKIKGSMGLAMKLNAILED